MARAKNRKSRGGVYKREGSPFWWYYHPVNKLRKSTGTTDRAAAEAFVAKMRLDAFNGQLGKKPSITLDTLLARYMEEHAQHLKSKRMQFRYCDVLLKNLGKNTIIETISPSVLSIYKAKRRAENRKLSNSTINRELEALRVAINTAKSWGYNVPDFSFKDVMLREPEARVKYLTPEQVESLLNACNKYIRYPVEFAMYTGLRADNIFGLRWEQVNLFSKEITVQIKSNIPGGKTLRLPISDKMMEILLKQTPAPKGLVFKNKVGKKVTRYNVYFSKARTRAGLDKESGYDTKFHDLRHHAATMLRKSGVPIEIVQQILGHTTITTTMKYAHISEDEIFAALNNLGHLAQNQHNRKAM